jgi:exonuclease 1
VFHRATDPLLTAFLQVVLNIRLEGNLPVPTDYIPNFQLAELVFLHQRVYDPRLKRLVTLLPLPEDGLDDEKCRYIGQYVSV